MSLEQHQVGETADLYTSAPGEPETIGGQAGHLRHLGAVPHHDDIDLVAHAHEGLHDELEDLVGAEVIGYRAPTYSIVKKTLWALDILLEQGFRYDSSIFPIVHDRYGIPSATRFPGVVRENGSASLLEKS